MCTRDEKEHMCEDLKYYKELEGKANKYEEWSSKKLLKDSEMRWDWDWARLRCHQTHESGIDNVYQWEDMMIDHI